MAGINLGLIGLGSIGQVHLRNCLLLRNANLTAVADVSKKALNCAKAAGVQDTFVDYHELLKRSNVDAVVVALPTHLHYECAIAAIESHKHVFLEKPIARNTVEGEAIAKAANKYGVKLMVGYPLRFSSSYQELKSKLVNCELGDVQIAHATNISTGPFTHRAETNSPVPVPEWWWDQNLTGGGALMDLGSHMIDLSRWYFGTVTSVKCYLGYRFNLPQEDHATCLLKFEHGQVCIISVGWFSQRAQIKMEVFGTSGHFTTLQWQQSKLRTAMGLLLNKPPASSWPYLREIQYFIGCLEAGIQPSPSAESALEDLKVIETAYANRLILD
jgi:predicted dehydrogenase